MEVTAWCLHKYMRERNYWDREGTDPRDTEHDNDDDGLT